MTEKRRVTSIMSLCKCMAEEEDRMTVKCQTSLKFTKDRNSCRVMITNDPKGDERRCIEMKVRKYKCRVSWNKKFSS